MCQLTMKGYSFGEASSLPTILNFELSLAWGVLTSERATLQSPMVGVVATLTVSDVGALGDILPY
jgi:hypothetical protein